MVGWTNPFEKYARQIGANFPKVRGENKKYLGNHQPVVFQRKSLFSTQVGKIQTTTSFTVACASSTYLRRRSVLNFEETKGRNHNNDNPMASRGTWRIIPVSKWLGSPPFTSYWKTWLQKEKCSFWPYVWSLPWLSQYFPLFPTKVKICTFQTWQPVSLKNHWNPRWSFCLKRSDFKLRYDNFPSSQRRRISLGHGNKKLAEQKQLRLLVEEILHWHEMYDILKKHGMITIIHHPKWLYNPFQVGL